MQISFLDHALLPLNSCFIRGLSGRRERFPFFSAVLRALCVANRELSRFRRAFSPTCPYRHSTSVPSIRDLHSSAAGEPRAHLKRREHGERRESQRSYQRFRAGKSATISVSASPQSSSARLCAALCGSVRLCCLRVLKGTTVLTERKLAGCDGG